MAVDFRFCIGESAETRASTIVVDVVDESYIALAIEMMRDVAADYA